MKKESLIREMEERFNIRISKDLKAQIDAKAMSLKITPSELARIAITNFIYKDVNISNELLGTLSGLQNDLEGIRRRIELHSNVFIYYLRFFFAFEGNELDKVPKEIRKQFFAKGEKRRDDFIRLFRQQNVNHVNIFELLLGEYLAEPTDIENEQNHSHSDSNEIEIED